MWALDGGSSTGKLVVIYPHLLFCARADAGPQWEERGVGKAVGRPAHGS